MSDTELLQFPCDFPLKIMGLNSDDFSKSIAAVVQRHCPDYDAAQMEIRPSKQGNYLGLTCTVRPQSRDQLDNLYRELCSHPLVKMVL